MSPRRVSASFVRCKRCSTTSREIRFTNVRVPAENIVGTEGDGFRHAQSWITENRLTLHARSASPERCLKLSVVRAQSRSTLASTRRASSRAIQTGRDVPAPLPDAAHDVRCCPAPGTWRRRALRLVHVQYFSDEAGFAAADHAMQIHGAMEATSDFPIETFFREARARHHRGSTDLLKMVVARHVLKRVRQLTQGVSSGRRPRRPAAFAVMKSLSAEERKTTAPTRSSPGLSAAQGTCRGRIGEACAAWAGCDDALGRSQSGAMQFTQMLSGPNSRAITRVIAMMAPSRR